jgi:hypothetical protein
MVTSRGNCCYQISSGMLVGSPPLLKSRQAVWRQARDSLSAQQDSSRPVREQTAQIDVATFANAT